MIGHMEQHAWEAGDEVHGGHVLGTVTIKIGRVTADEAVLVMQDVLGYLNERRPSANRVDALPPEPVRAAPPPSPAPPKVEQAAAVVAPPPPKDDGVVERTRQVAEAPARAAEPVAPDATPHPDAEDLVVFGRLTKLQDVVKELQRRGAVTFDEVQKRCADLRDAEVCPVLSRVADLETRLRTCCAALGVPGAV